MAHETRGRPHAPMSEHHARFPIGISDFRAVREGDFAYVDKTGLIEDVLHEGAQALLIPRPRRFGKTLNLSMLRYFLEKSPEDRSPLFAGLAVASSAIAKPHFQRYPVIFMSFKDVKPRSWEDCLAGMAMVLSETFGEHRYLLTGESLDPADAALFSAIRERRAAKSELTGALTLLSRLLARHHREKVVLLIDEYDSPIHAGYTNRYYDDVVAFFRDFLSGGLKDNDHLFKGVLTGILRVATGSRFSGLDNIDVYDIFRSRLATSFGFTEPEVRGLVDGAAQLEVLEGIRTYYGSYLFGGEAIYNPWSILCFLDRTDRVLRPYWLETNSTDLVRDLLLTSRGSVRAEIDTLLAGGMVEKRIEEGVLHHDASVRSDTVWSFLLFTGYLKAVEVYLLDGRQRGKLTVPNTEVTVALQELAQAWLDAPPQPRANMTKKKASTTPGARKGRRATPRVRP
jgi:Predicted AAA-ATPase